MGALFLKAIANIVCYQNHVIQKNLTSSHSHDIVIKLSLTHQPLHGTAQLLKECTAASR